VSAAVSEPPAGIDALVVSCYELGHQPVAAASATAFLRRAGHRVRAVDLAVERLDAAPPGPVRLVAVSVPMHTALRIAVRVADDLRRLAPEAHLCFFGLYAMLNAGHLLRRVCDSVIGGEAESPLSGLADALARREPLERVAGLCLPRRPAGAHLARLPFAVPDRTALPAVDRYAKLEIGDELRVAAAVEASRGCLRHCRHCPIPPVYGGRFFVVPRGIVLEDLRRLVAAGVRHVTFADPDFFNGPRHGLAIVREAHRIWPALTFDVTIKVEHILRHRQRLPELAAAGCLFVVSAVESLSDTVLANLSKGHTRADVDEALRLLREVGIALRPSLLPFTPWERIEDYLELLDWVGREDLVDHVDPVQYSIRLLVPPGSLLLELEALRPHLHALDPATFSFDWAHPDPRMDRLQSEVAEIVALDARSAAPDAHATFARIRSAARDLAGRAGRPSLLPARTRSRPPRLTEPWFC